MTTAEPHGVLSTGWGSAEGLLLSVPTYPWPLWSRRWSPPSTQADTCPGPQRDQPTVRSQCSLFQLTPSCSAPSGVKDVTGIWFHVQNRVLCFIHSGSVNQPKVTQHQTDPGNAAGNKTGKCVSGSAVRDSATPWTVACQAPLSIDFPRQEYWRSGCHFLLQGTFPTRGSNLGLLHCRWTLPSESTQQIPGTQPETKRTKALLFHDGDREQKCK